MADVDKNYEYVLKIDFEKNSENPERIFLSLYELIYAFRELDKTLVESFSVNIEPILVLQDIQPGSIRTILYSILKNIDDEALMNLDWKKIIGNFLVKAKHVVIRFLEDKNQISSIEPINELEKNIEKLAVETNVQIIPSYTKVSTKKLLDCIYYLSKAVHNLSENDKAILISSEGEVEINKKFYITEETIKEILKRNVHIQQSVGTLLIKKPDYLGQSMWDVQYRGRIVQAKILDSEWVYKFQHRQVNLLPGDSIRALVKEEIVLGENNEVIEEHYSILEIYSVINKSSQDQNYEQQQLF
ncbi:MAG TPA: hypothetical protein GXX35_06690 [Thermoanaerobacterales bacterium]|nr:hypothetical protein [Thermoanaerobacterales bacterium]